jgi:hypothetical protein
MAERTNDGDRVTKVSADGEVSLSAATNESFHRTVRDDEALNARIAAHQAIAEANELETENRILETEMAAERERYGANNMGLVLALCLVLAALVVTGFWMLGRLDRGPAVYTSATNGRTVIVQPVVR